ncbi:MAG: glycosyltransferase [Nitrospirae bacterium]|nr:glycosyltransferase [Nitrospirota bacterium]MBI5694946.1 glycosyltransferase [Nitrospirota bacterium]
MKVLLIAPSGAEVLGVIGRSVAAALGRLGHEVRHFDYRRGFVMPSGAGSALRSPFGIRLPFSPRSLPGVKWFEAVRRGQALLSTCGEFGPEVILVLKGEGLDGRLIREAKAASGAVTVNWFQDTVTLPVLRDIAVSVSGGYDFFFGIDDAEVLGQAGLRSGSAAFLPMGFDPEIYRKAGLSPDELEKYGSDLAFVGTMVPSRVQAFEELMLPGLRIWGPPVTVHGPWLRDGSPLVGCYTGVAPLGAEAAKVYRASRVTIGMHCNIGGTVTNVTPRVFEVPASGGFLLTDANPQLGHFYDTESEMATYGSLDELKDKAAYYLANPGERAAMAEKAHRRATAEHTCDKRLEEMFRIIGATI